MRLLNNHFPLFTLLAFLLTSTSSCVKRDFDEPPTGGEPVSVVSNTTIAALKALHVTTNGGFDKIVDDLIIEGTVIMDDRSGNYYKTLVIQDATGGIEVKFNDGYLFNQYPVGRKLFIYCKDLLLTDYNGLTQLTGSTVEQGGQLEDVGITEAQARTKVVKGPISATPPVPAVVSLNSLNASYVSTLVKLENVQFIAADAGKTYADPVTKYSLNRTIMNCTGGKVILRSSGYSEFAGALTPTGNGTITGVLGIYGNTLQLFIRDLSDVDMPADRCSGVGGQPMSIKDLRSFFTGTTTSAPTNRKIRGIVISDRTGNNLNGRNAYVQELDGSAGILVRFTANHSYNLGDEVEVEVSGQELSQFNGLLQVNNVQLDKSGALTSGNTPVVRTATTAQINANFDAWESTLVKITGATISGGGTPISGGKTVTDASGSIAMFTQSYATFASATTPSGTVTVTAIVSDFNGKQIILRNMNDIQ